MDRQTPPTQTPLHLDKRKKSCYTLNTKTGAFTMNKNTRSKTKTKKSPPQKKQKSKNPKRQKGKKAKRLSPKKVKRLYPQKSKKRKKQNAIVREHKRRMANFRRASSVYKYRSFIKTVASNTGLSYEKAKSLLDRQKNLSKGKISKYISSKIKKAGRKYSFDLHLKVKDRKGKTYITTIKGVAGKNKNIVSKTQTKYIMSQLRAWKLYRNTGSDRRKFSNNKQFNRVKELRILVIRNKI